MIAKNKAGELFVSHKGDLKACYVTATEVITELKRNNIDTKFWVNVIRCLDEFKRNLSK